MSLSISTGPEPAYQIPLYLRNPGGSLSGGAGDSLRDKLKEAPAKPSAVQGLERVVCEVDAVGQNAQNEVVERARQIRTLAAHAFEIGAGESKQTWRDRPKTRWRSAQNAGTSAGKSRAPGQTFTT